MKNDPIENSILGKDYFRSCRESWRYSAKTRPNAIDPDAYNLSIKNGKLEDYLSIYHSRKSNLDLKLKEVHSSLYKKHRGMQKKNPPFFYLYFDTLKLLERFEKSIFIEAHDEPHFGIHYKGNSEKINRRLSIYLIHNSEEIAAPNLELD